MSIVYILRTFVVIVLMSLWQAVLAQPSVDLFGRTIFIGAARDVVLPDLKAFRLQCLGEHSALLTKCDSVLVQGANPPFEAYANIYFQQDRIKSVRKYWSYDYEGKNQEAFVRTLFTVISVLRRETGMTPTITSSERRDPGSIQQKLFISAGRKSIEILYAEGLRGADGSAIAPFASLSEYAE